MRWECPSCQRGRYTRWLLRWTLTTALQQLRSSVQDYFAATFAYTNVTYETEVLTKLVIGDKLDKPLRTAYYTADDLSTACRLAEFKASGWRMTFGEYSACQVAHIYSITFGGLSFRRALPQ